MAIITEERVYTTGIAVLLMVEIFMAIPLVPDSIVKEGSSLIAIVAIGHFFWWLYGKTGMVRGANGLPHILGMLGLIISLMPAIGFLWHAVVAYMLFKSMVRMIKEYKK